MQETNFKTNSYLETGMWKLNVKMKEEAGEFQHKFQINSPKEFQLGVTV